MRRSVSLFPTLVIFAFCLLTFTCFVDAQTCGLPPYSNNLSCFNVVPSGTTAMPVALSNPIPTWISGTAGSHCLSNNPYSKEKCGALTGSGVTKTPSDFNIPIVRCTDSASVAGTGLGAAILWGVDDNGNPNIFAPDDSAVILKGNASTTPHYIFTFNGTTCEYTGISYTGPVIWDHSSPTTVYTLGGTYGTTLYEDTLPILSSCAPHCSVTQHTTIYEFRNSSCLQNTYNGNAYWPSAGWSGIFTDSGDDTTFDISFGDPSDSGQKGRYAASWNTTYGPTGGCDLWNTTNISNYSATNCPACSNPQTSFVIDHNGNQLGTANIAAPFAGSYFYQHENYSALNDTVSVVETSPGLYIGGPAYVEGFFFWTHGSSNVVHCGVSGVGGYSCAGHAIEGYQNILLGKQSSLIPYTSPALGPSATPNGSPCADAHLSMNHQDSSDQYPVTATSADVGSLSNLTTLQTAGSTTCPGSPTYSGIPPYYDEVYFGLPATDGSYTTGTVARVAHTFNSGWEWSFDQQVAGVGIESSSGKWLAFATDGWGQFGSTANIGSCNVGGPDWVKNDSSHFLIGTGFGSYIMPQSGNAGHYIYHVRSCSSSPCTTNPTSPPTWPQPGVVGTHGTTVTEASPGNITWETAADSQTPANSAISNCRSEVMLVKLFQ